ncbi:MAG TPA: hypothetical protein PLT83_01985, partial [Thermoleophilia bacterium]|nr:hypothetical protein [Thermoleophilia bacterium]
MRTSLTTARLAPPADAGDRATRLALELAAAEFCRRAHAARCSISAIHGAEAEVLATYARAGP